MSKQQGFVMNQTGISTGICPVCNTAIAAPDALSLSAAMVRHLNFTHDEPGEADL